MEKKQGSGKKGKVALPPFLNPPKPAAKPVAKPAAAVPPKPAAKPPHADPISSSRKPPKVADLRVGMVLYSTVTLQMFRILELHGEAGVTYETLTAYAGKGKAMAPAKGEKRTVVNGYQWLTGKRAVPYGTDIDDLCRRVESGEIQPAKRRPKPR